LHELKTLHSAEGFFRRLAEHVCAERRRLEDDAEGAYFRHIMDFLDTHFDDPQISMDRLSEELHISPSYVYRILRERNGRTFLEILTAKRIERACALLTQNKKVKDVASLVGYSSAKYFIRVFKKHRGLTPHRYRKSGA
jgi:YesN/AraC family two-component response regulator